MKKFILTILTGILLIMGISACSEKESSNADIVIFSQKGCPHCIHAMTFINGDLKQIVPNVTVQEYDINENRHNRELFAHTARRFKLGNQIGTPLIVVGENHIMGWTNDNQSKLIELVKQKKSKQ